MEVDIAASGEPRSRPTPVAGQDQLSEAPQRHAALLPGRLRIELCGSHLVLLSRLAGFDLHGPDQDSQAANLEDSVAALTSMKETRAVLLDLRGTLIDVAGGWKLTDNERARFLRSFDGAIHGADIQRALVEAVADVNAIARNRRGFFDQDRLVLARAAAKLGLTIPPERIDAFEDWRNRSFVRAVEAYPDAAPTLLGLRIAGVPTGCVADGRLHWVRVALERVGLLDLLDVVVASEESGEVKATGAALRLACARLGLDPSAVVFVGDRLDKDVAMARATGARAVLLVRGGNAHAPASSITSLTEILTWKLETAKETPRWSTPTISS